MKKIIYYYFFFIVANNYIACDYNCYEYSCQNCKSENIGDCTKCRNGFRLVDGTCPCADPACALCTTGLAGLNLCKLCKNGYYNDNNECYCAIENCQICPGNFCLKCKSGYFYNRLENKCDEETDTKRIQCFDPNCDACYTELEGGCDRCKTGYGLEKGKCISMPSPDENLICPTGFYYDEDIESCQRICDGVDCSNKVMYYYECDLNDCLVCTNNILQVYSQCDNSGICNVDDDEGKYEGCLNCITKDDCVICNQGYYLLGGECKKCIDGCAVCSNSDSCIDCFSGYELNSANTCVYTNKANFNTNLYKKYKNDLLKSYYPNEPRDDLEAVVIPECDKNCAKCYQNTGECLECKTHYLLEDNECVKHCSYSNCLECTIDLDDLEFCTKCETGYIVKNGKCIYNCTNRGCLSCTLEDNEEICTKCDINYSLDESSHKCNKSHNYISIIFSIIAILIILVSIIACCIYRKKRNDYRRSLMAMRYLPQEGFPQYQYPAQYQGGMVSVYNRNVNINGNEIGSEREPEVAPKPVFTKEELTDEFEIQKRKMEKGSPLCQYCKKNAGKFKCDCGCIVCKEHSNLKDMEGDGQNYKVCFACEKIVKKVTQIKADCHICMQKKLNVAHFKCGCALEVCKDCYIKCKMSNDKCPGCRALI